ncbi:hypothetical protein GCM10027262_46460 [Nocardia tengchongensis]
MLVRPLRRSGRFHRILFSAGEDGRNFLPRAFDLPGNLIFLAYDSDCIPNPEQCLHPKQQISASRHSRLLHYISPLRSSAVLEARERGAPWEEIGRAAGMTRQSAHERWAELTR